MADQDEWRKLRQRLIEQGFQLKLSKGSHYKVYLGQRMITSLSGSSGGGRGLQNAKATLRKAGAKV